MDGARGTYRKEEKCTQVIYRRENGAKRSLGRSSCNGENEMGVNQIRLTWEINCVGITLNFI